MDRENETRLIAALEKLATALSRAIDRQAFPMRYVRTTETGLEYSDSISGPWHKTAAYLATNVGPVRGETLKTGPLGGDVQFMPCRDCDRPGLCAILKQGTQPCWHPGAP